MNIKTLLADINKGLSDGSITLNTQVTCGLPSQFYRGTANVISKRKTWLPDVITSINVRNTIVCNCSDEPPTEFAIVLPDNAVRNAYIENPLFSE